VAKAIETALTRVLKGSFRIRLDQIMIGVLEVKTSLYQMTRDKSECASNKIG